MRKPSTSSSQSGGSLRSSVTPYTSMSIYIYICLYIYICSPETVGVTEAEQHRVRKLTSKPQLLNPEAEILTPFNAFKNLSPNLEVPTIPNQIPRLCSFSCDKTYPRACQPASILVTTTILLITTTSIAIAITAILHCHYDEITKTSLRPMTYSPP